MSIEAIKVDLSNAQDTERADAIFKSAYVAGYTLQELGDIVGVTRERIRQRVARPVNPAFMRTYDPAPRVTKKRDAYEFKKSNRKRILGVKTSAPALQIPVATLNELARLHQLVTEVRGWTPLSDPAREAVEPFGDLLWSTIQEYQIPQRQLEPLLGLSGGTFTAWLRSHGYTKQAPSQKTYQGIYSDPKERNGGRPKLEIGGHCRRGHELTKENLISNGLGSQCCYDCVKLKRKERYAQKKANQK